MTGTSFRKSAVKVPRYKIPRGLSDWEPRRPNPQDTAVREEFTGIVQGKAASDIEERFARALDKKGYDYEFRPVYLGGRNIPGSVELDFMVFVGGQQFAVQIDGEFAHKSAEQKANDRAKDGQLTQYLEGLLDAPRPMPFNPDGALVTRIPGDYLETQAEADWVVEGLF